MSLKSTLLAVGLLLLTGLLAACIQPLTLPTPEAEDGAGEETTLYVGPTMVDCVGVAPQTCLLVKTEPDADYTFFYNQIVGFDFVPGYAYELTVLIEDVPNPPADASSLRYTLVSVDSVTEVGPTLENTSWQLISVADEAGQVNPALDGVVADVLFADGSVSGSDGCNRFSGSYTVDGTSLTIGPELASTMMACLDPVMQQAGAYQAALMATNRYQIVNDQLRLLNADGRVVAVHEVRQSATLTDTLWTATLYNNGREAVVGLLADTEITALFNAEGQLSGSAGCNNYTAGYEVEGDRIQIGQVAMTAMLCPEPPELMEQEALYLAALAMAEVFTIDGDRLELRTVDGALVAAYQASAMAAEASAEVDDTTSSEISSETAATAADAEPALVHDGILGVEWHWFEFEGGDGQQVFVPDPSRYTLLLQPDGSASVLADCNRGNGTYTLDGGSLTIDIVALTRMLCPPDSLADDYLRLLDNVVTFVEDGDSLALNLFADTGNMYFQLETATAEAAHDPVSTIPQNAIELDPGDLATSYHWQVLPPTPYDATLPTGPVGAPARAVVTFDYLPAPQALAEGGPYLVVYPVDEKEALWQEAGDVTVSETIAALRTLLDERPANPAAPLPILPPSTLEVDLMVQPAYLDFGGGSGIRFVGRQTPDASPVLDEQLAYNFQGLTDDGRFYVAMRWPVASNVLPADEMGLTAAIQEAVDGDFAAYLQATSDALGALSPSDWSPRLDALDALVASFVLNAQ